MISNLVLGLSDAPPTTQGRLRTKVQASGTGQFFAANSLGPLSVKLREIGVST